LLSVVAVATAIAMPITTPALAGNPQPDPVLSWLPLPAPLGPPQTDVDYFMPRVSPSIQIDFATRFFYGMSTTAKNLYEPANIGSGQISRLTYSGLSSYTAELYGRIATSSGFFLKGFAGIGVTPSGQLHDEDFPPTISPYSSTISNQHSGYLNYFTGDAGYNFLRGGDFSLGAYVGYNYFNQGENAYGCTQTASNTSVCTPSYASGYQVIAENNVWQSLRVGLVGTVLLGDRFKLTGDAAFLPYVKLNGTDQHLLRIGTVPGDFSGPIAEDGAGWGYQLEAMLSYQVTQSFNIGVGGRYWHMQTTGNSLENIVGAGSFLAPNDWKTDVYGVFVQAGLKFGPYPLN
jgi:hypothetical protein